MEFLVRSRSAEMADSWCFCRQVRSIVAPLVAQREKKWPPPLRSVILVDGKNCVHPDSPDSYQGEGISECHFISLEMVKLDMMFVGGGSGVGGGWDGTCSSCIVLGALLGKVHMRIRSHHSQQFICRNCLAFIIILLIMPCTYYTI